MVSTAFIRYRAGYKYQLEDDFKIQTGIFGYTVRTKYATLDKDGWLYIFAGYAWDGPSGPTIDRDPNMRGSLPHDALYEMMRDGVLPLSIRDEADHLLLKCWLEDGMWRWLANIEVKAVEDFAEGAAKSEASHKILFAPARFEFCES